MKKTNANRSGTVFECWVCGALTNNLTFGRGMFGAGEKTFCPQSLLPWHHKLEKKVELLSQPHPKSYLEELAQEILAMRKFYASRTKNDLKGRFDLKKREWVDCVRSFKGTDGIGQELEQALAFRDEGLEFLRQRALRSS